MKTKEGDEDDQDGDKEEERLANKQREVQHNVTPEGTVEEEETRT